MSSLSKTLLSCVALCVLTACTAGTKLPSGTGVEIAVAPLSYPGIANVCYGLEVFNGPPGQSGTETVWSRAQICSSVFGNSAGGDISYVGPCDGSVGTHNYVELVLETVTVDGGATLDDQYTSTDGDADFVNPCPAVAPCALDFECVENADVLVQFNLTILRDAEQGFFDIAVNFDDIFCSAKLDCQYDDGPITLLHRPDGTRGQTAVLGFACTSGAGSTRDTVLHMNSIAIACGANTVLLDPTVGPGNAYTAVSPDPDNADAVWQYATYYGVEDLRCGAVPCNKLYWNIAIGFDPTFRDCTIVASATASTTTQMTNALTPPATTYPWIAFEGALTADANGGGLVCNQNPLNRPGSGVVTHYTPVATPKPFCHRYDGVTVATSAACQCTPATCDEIGAGLCGTFDDGCGGPLQCECTAPESCGGGGITGQCGCTPAVCDGESCEPIADGCGGTLSCHPAALPPRAFARQGISAQIKIDPLGNRSVVVPATALDAGSYDLQTAPGDLTLTMQRDSGGPLGSS